MINVPVMDCMSDIPLKHFEIAMRLVFSSVIQYWLGERDQHSQICRRTYQSTKALLED